MPIACAFVPAFPVAAARLADPRLGGRPAIVVDRLERGHVLDLDEEARALGARVGMTLAAAAACAREAAIAVHDPAACRKLWEHALDALDAASPLIEDAACGTALLEMRGIAGSERHWIASVREAFASDAELARLPLRVAVGPSPFIARAAAQAEDGGIVRAGQERAFLAPLPLRFLDLDPGTLARLELFGVRTLGELAELPHGPFVRRFGGEAARWHARACGRDMEPLTPRARAITIDHALYGEGTAEREEQLFFALRTLTARVAEDVAGNGKRCGSLHLELECEDGTASVLETMLAQPTAQSATMFDLVRARLEGTTFASPVSGMRLRAERLEEGGTELSLFAGRDPDLEIVGIALGRLEAALGPYAVRRARVGHGNRYETRLAYEPFNASTLIRTTRPNAAPEPPPATGTFTYRLLPPRAVEVRVRDGRPAFVGADAVLECAGPWRVDEAWWSGTLGAGGVAVTQDAYDVLLAGGTLCRLFKESGHWYIGGVYD
jgi:protein ImuB